MARNKKKNFKRGSKQATVKTADVTGVRTGTRDSKMNARFSDFTSRKSWKIDGFLFLFFFILTLILYSGTLRLGFFSIDDSGYITENPWIKSISSEHILFILTKPFFANFSPTHLFSYMLDYAIAGPDPYVFHLSNNVWSGVVAGFVYLLAFVLLRNRWMAISSALLFVFHPSHVEAVAWISSRKDLVAAAFLLPSFLTYLKYRKGGPSSTKWYILTLILFLFAIGGKMSVAVFPAVLFAHDLFVEKRPLLKSLVDKIPFLLLGIIFTLAVAGAQPPTGNKPDPFIYLSSLAQSLWLLSGFGTYVLQRVPPSGTSAGLEILSGIVLLAIFIAPFFLRRRYPLVTVLIYWVLFTYLPSQVLSFIHPVTDRYLFLPSVAAVILISLAIFSMALKYFKKSYTFISLASILIIALIWGLITNNYLREWQDPRSVWYAAVKKSPDTDVYYSLGTHYVTVAGQLGIIQRGGQLSQKEKIKLASKVWKEDPRLPALHEEWNKQIVSGPMELELQKDLWKLAESAFKTAFEKQGTRVMPHLYYRLGVLYLDWGNLEKSKQEFQNAINESLRYSVVEEGNKIIVVSYSNLAFISRKQSDFRQALKWYLLAEQKQKEFGGNWIPDISKQRKEMEDIVALLPGSPAINPGDINSSAAFSLGLYFLNASDRLGTRGRTSPFPLDESKILANEVWKNDSQLPGLLAEWSTGERGGLIENNFQAYVKAMAWDLFEKSLRAKGNAVNPNLFFRRGMMLGDRGDFAGARQEFLSAIKEAEQEMDNNMKQQYIVLSYDALGVIAWRETNYKEALQWFQTALQKQKETGGNWIPDLPNKINQMETMLNSK